MLAFEALPKMIGDVRNEELRAALEQHLVQTRVHVERVEDALRELGVEPLSQRSAALAALLEHHDAQDVREPGLRDLHHACGAIRVEHLEIGLYEALGQLDANRKDEEAALRRLRNVRNLLSSRLQSS